MYYLVDVLPPAATTVAAQGQHHAFSHQVVSKLPRAAKPVTPTRLYSLGNEPVHSIIPIADVLSVFTLTLIARRDIGMKLHF